MKFSKSLKQAILSDFPHNLATARFFEKSNNLTYLCNLEILHSCKTLKQFGNVLTETTADRKATYGYSAERYFLTSFTGDGPSEGESRSAGTKNNRAGEPATDAITIRTVDGEGNILTETNPNGNITTLTYDAHNRMLTQTGPLGSGRTMVYDNNGNVLSETTLNTTGNQVRTFVYDGANRRIISTNAQGEITTNTFDGNGNILTQSMPLGKQTAFAYNNLNLVTSKTEANETPAIWSYAYDLTGNLITETQPNNNVITTVYDDLNRPLSKTDSIGLISNFTYDSNSNIISETDGNSNITTHTYNALNQRVTTLKPMSRNYSYAYSLFDELISQTSPNGTINYTINSLGQRTHATGPDNYNEVYGFDVNDNLISYTDSRGNTTSYTVNALNQTTNQTTGSFSKTMGYDALGNKLSETDYRGIASNFGYDLENRQTSFSRAGNLQQTTVYNSAGLAQSVTDANGNTTVHQYNPQYYRTQTNLPETQVLKFTPDPFGNVTFQDNPGFNDITRVFDYRQRLTSETNGAGEKTQYEYDLNNNKVAEIKPNGARWEYQYDGANRLISIKNIDESIETVFGYDNRDNLISITDAENKETTFIFDNRNRKLSKVYPDGQAVNYSYDANGNIKTVGLPNGVGISYDYDVLNRQTAKHYIGTSGSTDIEFTLDGNGNIIKATETEDGNVSNIDATFDNLDRIISITDHHENSLQFGYDNNGNRKVLNDPKNSQSNYVYDDLNRLATAVMVGTGSFDYLYNSSGLMSGIDYPTNGDIKFTYDNANRIDVITAKQSGATVATYNYQYDPNGNRTSVTQNNVNGSETINYIYDRADRLTQVQYPDVTVDYVLDKVGNRKTETIDNGSTTVTKTYSYNNRDQLAGIVGTDGLSITYSYDNAGNQTQMIRNGEVTTFDYNPRQRVKTITKNSLPIHYKYDYLGNRIEKSSNGNTTLYTYDGTSLLYQTNTIGNVIAKYHYGSDRALAETRNGQNSYIYHDALRTPIAITNQDGSIQNRMDYDAYGNLKSQSSTSEHPIGFTGYHYDADTGLYYAKARYYSPEEGRFITNDPLEGNVQDPPSLHRYLYTNANPTAFIDPTGEGNDTPHYYDALLIASVVRLNEYEAYAYALGAEAGDEFEQHDAIHNSKSYGVLLLQNKFNSNASEVQKAKSKAVINNCGSHALCGGDPKFIRRAVNSYTLNQANNYAEVGTADHANTDSYFHIEIDTLGSDNEKSHQPVLGHLGEMKSTDKSFLYHRSKRTKAFKARAWLLYNYTVKQGTQKLSKKDFQDDLNKAVKALDDQYSGLIQNNRELKYVDGGVYTWVPKLDEISDLEEFNMVADMLKAKGFDNLPRTEKHSPGANINNLLNDFSREKLLGIAFTMDPKDDQMLRHFNKKLLIDYLNKKFFQAQVKSRDAVFFGVVNEMLKEETVKEDKKGPGVKELSK